MLLTAEPSLSPAYGSLTIPLCTHACMCAHTHTHTFGTIMDTVMVRANSHVGKPRREASDVSDLPLPLKCVNDMTKVRSFCVILNVNKVSLSTTVTSVYSSSILILTQLSLVFLSSQSNNFQCVVS